MKTCPRCGASCADDDRFCSNCGSPMPDYGNSARTDAQGPRYEQPRYAQGPAYQGGYRRPGRSVALAIILSIITCGIYGIYWFVVLTDEINELTGEGSPSGVVSFLLSLVTCGIYGIYWAYVMGRKVARLNRTADSGIINLIIALLGFQIVNLALFQDAVNHYAG